MKCFMFLTLILTSITLIFECWDINFIYSFTWVFTASSSSCENKIDNILRFELMIALRENLQRTLPTWMKVDWLDVFQFESFFFWDITKKVMRSLIDSEGKRVKDSDAKRLKEDREKDRVSIYGDEEKEWDVIEERERRDEIKVYEDSFMIKWTLSSIR